MARKRYKPVEFVAKVDIIERNLSVLGFMAWAKLFGVDPGKVLAAENRGLQSGEEI